MDQPSDILVFGLGCTGALAPEIVRLYRLRTRIHKMKFSYGYFLITGCYVVLAGVLAYVLHSGTRLGALYDGITMPVMISMPGRWRAHARDAAPIQAAEPPEPTKWQRFKWLIEEHSDGLF